MTDPYVRKYWTAAIGPQAVADLMRLVRAAERGQRIRRPVRLAVIIETGLGFWVGGELFVSRHIPQPPDHLLPRRLR